jgi:hypothetical protein
MKRVFFSLCAAVMLASVAVPARAQYYGPNNQYGDPVCGVWANGTWQDNGQCPGYSAGPKRGRVTGTIVSVQGNIVTLQSRRRTVTVNDRPALRRETTGQVAVGRQIVAFGYWRNDVFYATAFQ